jgi:hypothetical protein
MWTNKSRKLYTKIKHKILESSKTKNPRTNNFFKKKQHTMGSIRCGIESSVFITSGRSIAKFGQVMGIAGKM